MDHSYYFELRQARMYFKGWGLSQRLGLDGQLVVYFKVPSNTLFGRIVPGEGMDSLAHGFLIAGPLLRG